MFQAVGCIQSDNDMKSEEKTIDYLRLTLMKGIGPVRANHLVELCGAANACFCIDENSLLEVEREYIRQNGYSEIGEKRLRSFIEYRDSAAIREEAEKIIRDCDLAGVSIITKEDARYPNRLAGLKDSPVLIYVKGDLRINAYPKSIGIIGARRCSIYGKKKAIDVAEYAVENDCAVISGMAKGIDSYAHTAVLKSEGYTIAVLGCGADICYPVEHQELYEKISKRGCIISEYPPGTKPRQYMFPQRNRLIAALSDELYVVDAGAKSGTETTIAACIAYGGGREVHQI